MSASKDQTLARPHTLRGSLRVPSDRSITVRAVLLAGLAAGVSQVRQPLACDDTDACIACVRALGVRIETAADGALTLHGRGLHGWQAPKTALFCGSSGATMRLLSGLISGQRFDSTLDGTAQLRKRPMNRISAPLRMMGSQITDSAGCAPLHVKGRTTPLRSVEYHTPVASAQVKSAVLLAGLYADGDTTVIEDAPTRDHTERMFVGMGVPVRTEVMGSTRRITMTPAKTLQPLDVTVPADFSSAAFFMVAASIVPGAQLTLRDVGLNDTRTGLLDCLRAMGAKISIAHARDEGGEPVGDLCVAFDELNPIEVTGELTARTIDELPILAVAATQAAGRTVVRNAEELRVKESNRLEGFVAELRKLGADIVPTPDGFEINGPTQLHGAVVDGMGDHRVAMALAVAALVASGETTITGADCVSKTYPGFFDDLASISV